MPPYRNSMVYKGSPLYFAGVDEVRARPVAPRHLEGGEGFGVDGLKHIELPGHHDQAVTKRDRGFVGRLLLGLAGACRLRSQSRKAPLSTNAKSVSRRTSPYRHGMSWRLTLCTSTYHTYV